MSVSGRLATSSSGVSGHGYLGAPGYGVYGFSWSGYAGGFNGDVVVTGRTTTDVLKITGAADLSERFEIQGLGSGDPPSPGMVVSIDPGNPGALVVSSHAHDKRVAGIISGARGVKPGLLMGQTDTAVDGENPVALTGRV